MDTPLSGMHADQPARIAELPEKRVLMFLAEGFEDFEAVCAFDVLGWTAYRPSIATVSLDITGLHNRVRGGLGVEMDVDVAFDDVVPADYDALVIPGGFHNRGFGEVYDERVFELVRAMRRLGRPIATMCVGVLPVAMASELAGGRATTYPLSSRHDNVGVLRAYGCEYVEEAYVEWQGILSCAGPAGSEQVMRRLLELVAGPDAAAEVARYRSGRP